MADKESGKSKFNPLRIILILILIAAVGALVYDYRARGARDAVYTELEPLLPKDEDIANQNVKESATLATWKDVQKKIGRKPDESKSQGGGQNEIYIWPGVFYVYKIELQFSGGDKAFLRMQKDSNSRFSR